MSQSQTQPKSPVSSQVPSQLSSQMRMELEKEVRLKVREFMTDYEEDLIHGLNTALQYYFVTLNIYASRKGAYCVISDDFYNEFTRIRDMITRSINVRLKLRTPDCFVDASDALDEFSKLFYILSNTDSSFLVNSREETERQLEKARYVVEMVKDYMSNKLSDKNFEI